MKLLQDDALLLSYGGTGQYKLIGIGLVISGICFGLLPLAIYLRNKQIAFVIISVFGLLMLAGGIWALSYRHSVILDKTVATIRISSSSLFGKSERLIPFARIQEIDIGQRIYSSATSQVARKMFYMSFKLKDDSTFDLEDEDFNDTEEKTRKRASKLAAFCDTVVK